MIITVTLGVVGLLFLLLLVWLARGHLLATRNLENLDRDIRPVDVAAFRNLVDPEEDEYLQTRLAPAEFRTIRRERLRAAVRYVSGAARNAAIMMQMGEAARRSLDPKIAEAGEKLVDSALRLRLSAIQTTAKLYMGMILPQTRVAPHGLTENYEHMTRLVVLLGCLRYPTRGVSAAL